ncbi:MAG: hypothetical protein MZV63_54945 [Marinilabiliales bacterium]|nr:hypothetical protein [Marinilabiliales bacterium]
MTEEESDNGLENLFRNKLEENEMVAGSDLTGRFMRRLDRREFFRFNPVRFNIWYVTAAAAGLHCRRHALLPVHPGAKLIPSAPAGSPREHSTVSGWQCRK